MEIDFSAIMSKQTNSELVEILTIKKDEYQPEALSAAKAELENRNLSIGEMESASQTAKIKVQAKIDQANVPLALSGKLFTFFFPGWLVLLVARALKAEGYEQKYKDAWRWTLAGFAFYAILLIVILNI